MLIKPLVRAIAPFMYKAVGANVFQFYSWIKKTEKWPPEQRQIWRLARLNAILKFCWDHVPFYRQFWGDHGLQYRELQTLDELSSYPVVKKADLKANIEQTKPDNLHQLRYIHKSTGGTTGMPLTYLQDIDHWALIQAYTLWGWGLAGYHFGEPMIVLAGGSLVPGQMSAKDKLRSFVERRKLLFGVQMNQDLALDYYRQIRAFKTRFIYGYPSIISTFADFLNKLGLQLTCLKAVITTAEMLQPQYRKNIEKTLQCPVYNDYGANDGGMLSFECSLHQGLHYNDLQSILETDRKGNASMQPLLITNLWNKATPFIRYENGDSIVLSAETCKCGRQFPLIASINGRTMDLLTLANGKVVSGPGLTLIFRDMEIQGWQVVQRAPDKLEIRIQSPDPLKADYLDHIKDVFHFHLGREIKLEIQVREKLATASSGKLKLVWVEYE